MHALAQPQPRQFYHIHKLTSWCKRRLLHDALSRALSVSRGGCLLLLRRQNNVVLLFSLFTYAAITQKIKTQVSATWSQRTDGTFGRLKIEVTIGAQQKILVNVQYVASSFKKKTTTAIRFCSRRIGFRRGQKTPTP